MVSPLGGNLVFLISQPRAGSTLLQRILAGHPLIETSAEPWLMLHPVYALRDRGLQAEYDARGAFAGLQDFLTYYGDGEETYLQAIRALAQVLYGRALAGKSKQFFLDKTPRYHFIISELYRLFPEAKFIFLIRNPLAVLNSILSSWIKRDWPGLARFRYDLLLAPGRILEAIDQMGDKVAVVHYENLVTEPTECILSLCRQLEIEFFENMLCYGERPAPQGRYGDNIGITMYDSPSPASLDKWIHLADEMQTRHFALAYLDELGPQTIARLGYSHQTLRDTIESVETVSSAPIIPWHIAIRPAETWSRRERLVVQRAMAIQREGMLRGTVSFVRENYRPLVRSILPV